MEALRADIEKFLSTMSGKGYGYGEGGYGSGGGSGSGLGSGCGLGNGEGYGYGDGNGSGYGNGYGYASGEGDGSGYGSGSCSVSGEGYGTGCGIKSYCGQSIYMIDNVPTLIDGVKGNYARGAILQGDLMIKPCYIAKYENYYAHGKTLREAYEDATSKALSHKPVEDRISDFIAYCRGKDKLPAKELFAWHGVLTGSCKFGRAEFCRSHNIDIERDSFTLAEFISLTKDSYGSNIINQLKDR